MSFTSDPVISDDLYRPLSHAEQRTLFSVALGSITHGLRFNEPLPVRTDTYGPRLQVTQACFVSLHRYEELRGCVGTLEATRPLVRQVAESAFDAAFRDGRLLPIASEELNDLTIEISLLSPLTDMDVATERQLFGSLRRGVDGLVVSEGDRRATFLPKVWDSFELPFDFVEHLKRKAGLPPRYWSPALRFQRYTVESFSAGVAELVAGG